MAGAAVDTEPKRRAHLLRGRAKVEDAPTQLDALAPALVDRIVGADRVRVLLAEPRQAEPLADLLVGGRDEDQVSRGLEPLAREGRDRDRARSNLALHIERPAAPDLAVAQLARPRTDLPLGRIRQNGVGVREEEQARATAAPRQPRDEIRALGHLRVELALDAVLGEVVAQQLRRDRLVAGRVDGVELNQLPQELDNLGAEPLAWPDQSSSLASWVSWFLARQSSG